MPSRFKVLSGKELAIAREEALPVVHQVIDLLLRSGPRGIVEFQRTILKECEKEKQTNSAYNHINPEGLKDVFQQCGMILTPEQYHKLFVAYGDPVGFILLDPLMSDVNPTRQLTKRQMEALRALFPPAVSISESPDGSTVEKLPPVKLQSVLEALTALLAPVEETAEEGSTTTNNASAVLQSVYEEAAELFTLEQYPQDQVPSLDVLSFLAAFLYLLPQQTGGQDAVRHLQQRLEATTPLVEAASRPMANTATATATVAGTTTRGAVGDGQAVPSVMTHTYTRTERKFDHYDSTDRRDEWLRGRPETDAKESYQKHVVGYSGHLPEYRYRFGRTFHVIEEDLPVLSKPKPPQEPVAPDTYGRPVELKYSRMSEHHHKFA